MVVEAHTHYHRDGANNSIKFCPTLTLTHLRDIIITFACWYIFRCCHRDGKIDQKWQVKMQEFGKEGFVLQTCRGIDDLSCRGLAPPLSAGLVSLVHCSSQKRNRFFPPLTPLYCERIMVRDEPTPLMLGLCIYGWINGYCSLCLNMFSECRFSSKFKCPETVELNVYIRTLPNHASLI